MYKEKVLDVATVNPYCIIQINVRIINCNYDIFFLNTGYFVRLTTALSKTSQEMSK